MSDGAAGSLYAIDSSSLMDWQARHYPADIFPGVVDRMDKLVGEGRDQRQLELPPGDN